VHGRGLVLFWLCNDMLCTSGFVDEVIFPIMGPVGHVDTVAGWRWLRCDLPSTPSDNLRKLIYLATEALSDSFECIGAI